MFTNTKNHRYKYICTLAILFFGAVSSVYGYMTGSTFIIFSLFPNLLVLKIVFFIAILFTIMGISTYSYIYYSLKSPSIKDWVITTFILVIILFTTKKDVDIEEFFRIYISPISFYFMFIFSLIYYFKQIKIDHKIKYKYFFIFAFLYFIIGVSIYFFKNEFILTGNYNFFIQFVIVMFCIVFPVYFLFLTRASSPLVTRKPKKR